LVNKKNPLLVKWVGATVWVDPKVGYTPSHCLNSPFLDQKNAKKSTILLRICENHHVAGEKHPLMSTVNPGEDYLSSSTAGLIFPPFPEQGLRLATFYMG
jgi:hypothetical protein